VVFLIKENNARRIARKIRDGLTNKGVNTENLIILYYSFDTIDTIFCYIFKKVIINSPNFSNEFFEDINPLNEAFGEKNDFEGIRPSTRRFWPYRSRCPVMNDDPPPVYLASLLWMDYFYDMLTPEQKENIRSGAGHQIINVNLNDLKDYVNQDFPVSSSSLKETLDFLVGGSLAEASEKEDIDFEVKYHRLKSTREVYSKQEKEKRRREFRELSEKFINHYIKNCEKEKKKKKKEEKYKTKYLDEYLNPNRGN